MKQKSLNTLCKLEILIHQIDHYEGIKNDKKIMWGIKKKQSKTNKNTKHTTMKTICMCITMSERCAQDYKGICKT